VAVRNDLRLHSKEIEDLLARVATLETGRSSTDPATMGSKKMAVKFGARMDDFEARLQVLEADKPEAHTEAG
jgi:hypothetical protein